MYNRSRKCHNNTFVASNTFVESFIPISILGQVWCLIVSIPDLCPFSNFVTMVARLRRCYVQLMRSCFVATELP